MQSYPKRVADNILPLSVAGTLPAAFREWRFTGETVDHEVANETCRLCEQEGLRYHFEILNDRTGHRLDVGSECILKFQVAIFEEGRELSPEQARKALADRMRQMRLESCLRALERLAAVETNDILANALAYYRLHKALTPKFANVVFWRLQANGIDHDPGFFKVRLDKNSFVEDLRAMPPRNVHRIWKALTSSQRKKAEELGHTAPPG
jgi:Mg-chelatase subunit ChlI